MTHEPMWTDEHDGHPITSPALDREGHQKLRKGHGVRIVTPLGVVYQGVIERLGGHDETKPTSVWLHGKMFGLGQHTVYAVDVEGIVPIDSDRREFSAEEIRDTVADQSSAEGRYDGKPAVVSLSAIINSMLGFSPASHGRSKDFGGKSDEGWMNEFVSVSAVKRKLGELVDAGALVAVRSGNRSKPSNDSLYVSFGGRGNSGWVLAADYESSKANQRQKSLERQMDKLRSEARAIVADRHAIEVEKVLAELATKVGE